MIKNHRYLILALFLAHAQCIVPSTYRNLSAEQVTNMVNQLTSPFKDLQREMYEKMAEKLGRNEINNLANDINLKATQYYATHSSQNLPNIKLLWACLSLYFLKEKYKDIPILSFITNLSEQLFPLFQSDLQRTRRPPRPYTTYAIRHMKDIIIEACKNDNNLIIALLAQLAM